MVVKRAVSCELEQQTEAEARTLSLMCELEEALEDSEEVYKENKCLKEKISDFEDKTCFHYLVYQNFHSLQECCHCHQFTALTISSLLPNVMINKQINQSTYLFQ